MKGHDRQTEPVWITGVNPVREALSTGGVSARELVLARTDARGQELAELARRTGVPSRQEARRDALTALVGHEHHQGVALKAEQFPYLPLEALLELDPAQREPLVILDCVQDPQNLGALIRSACFLGARGIVVPKDRSARVTATVMKVAAGATSYVPVVQVVNLTRALEGMKEAGLWIVGLDVEGGRSLYEADFSMPLGIVVGNEQKGIRPLVRKHCDLLVQIPAAGPIQSLNASVAGAVALAEVQRQRLTRAGS